MRCLGKRFPTLIASGEMSSSQMRCDHNHNHRLQPPKRQEQGKSARFCGLPESRFPKKEKSKVRSHCFFLSFQKATSFI